MMFTPMLFIKNFFSWSLFFTSLIVLIHWEIQYSKHPERFWEGSNSTLKCLNCKERTCQIKRTIKNKVSNKNKTKENVCVQNQITLPDTSYDKSLVVNENIDNMIEEKK